MDWVNDKIYFTDASLDIVGVYDPVSFYYKVLISTGSSTDVRAIVLDPNARYVCVVLVTVILITITIYHTLHEPQHAHMILPVYPSVCSYVLDFSL